MTTDEVNYKIIISKGTLKMARSCQYGMMEYLKSMVKSKNHSIANIVSMSASVHIENWEFR